MKKGILLAVFVMLMLSILFVSVFAESGNGNDDDDSNREDSDDDSDSDDEEDDSDSDDDDSDDEDDSNSDDELDKYKFEKEEKFVDENGNVVVVKSKIEIEGDNVKKKIKVTSGDEEYEVETELEVEEDESKEKIKVKSSSGAQKLINVMPNDAFNIAMQELGSEDITLVLSEVDGEIVYAAETEKEGKLLGIIKKKMKLEMEIDAETGEIIKIKKKWWAIFVSGEDDIQLGDKVTICHLSSGDDEDDDGNETEDDSDDEDDSDSDDDSFMHTITIGSPAVKAHLKHGDYLGACETDNNGVDGNETLFVNIQSPQNAAYNVSEILVNISSNGMVTYSINNASVDNYTSSVIKTFVNGTNSVEAFAVLNNETATDSVVFSVTLDIFQ